MAANVEGEGIFGEVIKDVAVQLRVLKARVEGNVEQGRVVGECEVIEEGQGEA